MMLLFLLVADGAALERAAALRSQPAAACETALSDATPEMRETALYCVEQRRVPDVASRLVAALADPDEEVSATARILLVRYEPETAVATATPALRSDIADELARLLLRRAGASGPLRMRYHRVLTLLSEDEEASVRNEAEQALEQVVGKY
jgi:HEAT repeat protein